MIDTRKELNTIKRGHTAVQLRGHSSCVVTQNNLFKIEYFWRLVNNPAESLRILSVSRDVAI